MRGKFFCEMLQVLQELLANRAPGPDGLTHESFRVDDDIRHAALLFTPWRSVCVPSCLVFRRQPAVLAPHWHGWRDIGLVSPVSRDDTARPETERVPGLAAADAARRKQRETYPQLLAARRCKLKLGGGLRRKLSRSCAYSPRLRCCGAWPVAAALYVRRK